MDSKAWYVEFRPSTLKEYAGDDVVEQIENRFRNKENKPNVIFVHGTHGCGKTTICRILAKYYMCENPHEDGTPCEKCEMCRQINEILIAGESGVEVEGVKEINGVIANGKGVVQEVMEEALMEPLYTKYKIRIFDECHKMTDAAQNSMLKDLEDIPSHLVIMFATTEPDKVIDTIKSRVHMEIEVRKKTEKQICDRLMEISRIKCLTVSKDALKLIAKKGDRIPRDCITILENTAKTYGGQVTLDNVRKLTSSIGEELYIEYFNACKSGIESLLKFNNKLKDLEISPNKFLSGLSRFILDSMYILYGVKMEEYSREFCKSAKILFSGYVNVSFNELLNIVENTNRSITSDDNKNELSITNMGIKIGKVRTGDSLDANLASENIKSTKKYVEQEVEAQTAKSNIDKINNKEKITKAFDSVFADKMETLSDNSGNKYVLSDREIANILDKKTQVESVLEKEESVDESDSSKDDLEEESLLDINLDNDYNDEEEEFEIPSYLSENV